MNSLGEGSERRNIHLSVRQQSLAAPGETMVSAKRIVKSAVTQLAVALGTGVASETLSCSD
jgi:hypothetical protein